MIKLGLLVNVIVIIICWCMLLENWWGYCLRWFLGCGILICFIKDKVCWYVFLVFICMLVWMVLVNWCLMVNSGLSEVMGFWKIKLILLLCILCIVCGERLEIFLLFKYILLFVIVFGGLSRLIIVLLIVDFLVFDFLIILIILLCWIFKVSDFIVVCILWWEGYLILRFLIFKSDILLDFYCCGSILFCLKYISE